MSNKTHKVDTCEVCGNNNLSLVLNLGNHPMCDDLISLNEERVCNEYPIEILFCNDCKTAHQKYQVPKKELFPDSYHYRSRFTSDVLKGMENLVAATINRFNQVESKIVLDIGCNDGSLLDFFKKSGAKTIGIEPTNAYKDAEKKGHITYHNFVSKQIANLIVSEHGKPDFITFTNVFAHIENLKEVLDSLKILMHVDTVVIIENHYLGAVLERFQFDTFYHEHPRTYSYTSFVHMSHNLGVKLLDVEFPSRYGGNIRVFLGNRDISENNNLFNTDQLKQNEDGFFRDFEALNINIETWVVNKKNDLDKLIKKHGKIKAKAFPGRAAILIKMLKLDESMISAVYEKPGSLKIGHFLPGTKIPIKSDDELFSNEDLTEPIINLAWHISGEIKQYLINSGYEGQIIDILSTKDF